jgi:hypothetical protein
MSEEALDLVYSPVYGGGVAVNPGRSVLLQETERRLRRLSAERLRVASDFLAYLEERESSEATQELLEMPDFEEAFRRAEQQVKEGQVVRFADIQRDV